MPSGPVRASSPLQLDGLIPNTPAQPSVQVKACTICLGPVDVASTQSFSPDTPNSALLCIACAERHALSLVGLVANVVKEREKDRERENDTVVDVHMVETANVESSTLVVPEALVIQSHDDTERRFDPPDYPFHPRSPTPPPPPSASASTAHFPVSQASCTPIPQPLPRQAPDISPQTPLPPPPPFEDLTRLRVRSVSHECLYPGAKFSGTQRSGRNSYDVTVTVVDVDFSSSFLCGYLCIRGLTLEYPEMTTYFDGEIIGSRYGFLTQDWGATEEEDRKHWSRFPAFRALRHELQQPNLTIRDADRGVIFMRWKERFLVPDHNVKDINGASFAGFYYVCIEFGPNASHRVLPSIDDEEAVDHSELGTPIHPPHGIRRGRRRASSIDPEAIPTGFGRSPSLIQSLHGPAAMSGFYYHPRSQQGIDQQLSLHHIPDRTYSTFEFR